MASRTLNLMETQNHRVVTIFGSFLPQGASAPLPNPIWAGSPALGQWGQGIASIAFSATGVWLATLTDAWYRIIGTGGAEVRMADGAAIANPNTAALQNINVTGSIVNSIPAKTLNITNTSGGSLANIAAGTNQLVYFTLQVQNTSVQ
jgi:hypothetical protein